MQYSEQYCKIYYSCSYIALCTVSLSDTVEMYSAAIYVNMHVVTVCVHEQNPTNIFLSTYQVQVTHDVSVSNSPTRTALGVLYTRHTLSVSPYLLTGQTLAVSSILIMISLLWYAINRFTIHIIITDSYIILQGETLVTSVLIVVCVIPSPAPVSLSQTQI